MDGGHTTLISPVLDASDDNAILQYTRWFSNNNGAAPNADVLIVRVSDDAGATWTTLEEIGPSGPEAGGGWFTVQIDVASITGIQPNNQLRLSFDASDLADGSVVEAGVDGIIITSIDCEDCTGDLDGNGVVDVEDILLVIAGFGSDYTVDDILIVLGAFGDSC